jgi:cell wall-associated NlpC family hydrolase
MCVRCAIMINKNTTYLLPAKSKHSILWIKPRHLIRLFPVLILVVIIAGCGVSKPRVRSTGRTVSRPATVGDKVVLTAKKCIGTPYRYGGESPRSGFDCSGLTYYVYKRYGFSLPRRAKDQMKVGRQVGRRELRPGDLVFFKRYGAYHVGLYAGNGKFIHAPRSGKCVKTESLNKGYYRRNYYTARRVLDRG